MLKHVRFHLSKRTLFVHLYLSKGIVSTLHAQEFCYRVMINMMDEIVDKAIEKFTPLIHRVAKNSLNTGRVTTKSRTQDRFANSFLNSHKRSGKTVSIQKEYTLNILTLRQLILYIYIYIYIYGAPILDVSRSHTTTHHSR